jgi:hypothetical protein
MRTFVHRVEFGHERAHRAASVESRVPSDAWHHRSAEEDASVLIVMAGLPGSGKSAVAEAVGRALKLPVLSVDPIEAAMCRAGIERTQPIGLAAYVVAEAVAGDILALGQSVVVDAVNAVEPARQMWRELAKTDQTEGTGPGGSLLKCATHSEMRQGVFWYIVWSTDFVFAWRMRVGIGFF